MVCRTTVNGTFETDRSAVRIDLIEREGDKAAQLQMFPPVGLYLPAGDSSMLTVSTFVAVSSVWKGSARTSAATP